MSNSQHFLSHTVSHPSQVWCSEVRVSILCKNTETRVTHRKTIASDFLNGCKNDTAKAEQLAAAPSTAADTHTASVTKTNSSYVLYIPGNKAHYDSDKHTNDSPFMSTAWIQSKITLLPQLHPTSSNKQLQ